MNPQSQSTNISNCQHSSNNHNQFNALNRGANQPRVNLAIAEGAENKMDQIFPESPADDDYDDIYNDVNVFTENNNNDSQYMLDSIQVSLHIYPLMSKPFTLMMRIGLRTDHEGLKELRNIFQAALDSDCSDHIVRDKSLFWTYNTEEEVDSETANCGVLKAYTRGIVKLQVRCGKVNVELILCGCLHAPDAPMNLISVNALTEERIGVFFTTG